MKLCRLNGQTVKFDVLLLVTDAAPHMESAAQGLPQSDLELIRVTCLVHTLHRVYETIRVFYPNVDMFRDVNFKAI